MPCARTGLVMILALALGGCASADAPEHVSVVRPALADPCVPADLLDKWQLPACDRACDRVVACGVEACVGYAWHSAGMLVERCLAACDDTRAAEIEAATSCEAVIEVARAADPTFEMGCDSDACANACRRFADCTGEVCPAPAANEIEGLETNCLAGCDPATITWVFGPATCQDLIDAINESNPDFLAFCTGTERPCPDETLCEPYADKTTGCALAHCDGHLDPFEEGLRLAILDYCLNGADCPSDDVVTQLIAPAMTCETPPFDGVGPAPPFTAMCLGTLPVTFEAIASACQDLVACPGMETLSLDLCYVLLALREDVATVVPCLNGAPDCGARFTCVEP